MATFVNNWKTTLTGVCTILYGIAQIVNGQVEQGVGFIVTGMGLLFAKDFNVSGK